MIVDRYYYGRLTDTEKQIYREIYDGCIKHQDIIRISSFETVGSKSHSRIMQALMDDNPLLYYLNQSVLEFVNDIYGNNAVVPQYFFSPENVEKYNQKIQDAANRIICDLKLTEGSDLDKVRKVHDYMCRNITYDYGGSNVKDTARLIAAHNIIGVFAHRKAQCEGIAKAAKVLLNAVDVRCIIAMGQVRNLRGTISDHCWNIVNIAGDPYHLDITFDIGAGTAKYISYDYYNITDSQIRRDHIFSAGLPKCSRKQANYFEQEGLIFTSKRQLQKYISDQVKKEPKTIYVRLSGKLKAEELADEMVTYALQIIDDRGLSQVTAHKTVNEIANTCRITFR